MATGSVLELDIEPRENPGLQFATATLVMFRSLLLVSIAVSGCKSLHLYPLPSAFEVTALAANSTRGFFGSRTFDEVGALDNA